MAGCGGKKRKQCDIIEKSPKVMLIHTTTLVFKGTFWYNERVLDEGQIARQGEITKHRLTLLEASEAMLPRNKNTTSSIPAGGVFFILFHGYVIRELSQLHYRLVPPQARQTANLKSHCREKSR